MATSTTSMGELRFPTGPYLFARKQVCRRFRLTQTFFERRYNYHSAVIYTVVRRMLFQSLRADLGLVSAPWRAADSETSPQHGIVNKEYLLVYACGACLSCGWSLTLCSLPTRSKYRVFSDQPQSIQLLRYDTIDRLILLLLKLVHAKLRPQLPAHVASCPLPPEDWFTMDPTKRFGHWGSRGNIINVLTTGVSSLRSWARLPQSYLRALQVQKLNACY